MIQELFGGAGASFLGGGGDSRKICFNGMLDNSPSPSPALSTTSSKNNSTPTTPTTTAPPPPDSQNLRCPRCDSSNTKFCYYNNYNLTQPRHFCKTCRRYWTKGGALRNVPIGGGCRKNKTTAAATTTPVKSTSGKIKTMSSEFGKSNFGFDLDPPSNSLLWTAPQNSQLMALLRATQNQNPNPNSVSNIKQEEPMIGSYNMSGCGSDNSALNARPINVVDPLAQFPSAAFWRNNQHQQQPQSYQNQNQQHHSNLSMADLQSTGIQELFQRLRSTGNYYSDHSTSQLSNIGMHHTSSPAIIEPSSITGADVGYWNTPTFAWSNLSTTNGAFP